MVKIKIYRRIGASYTENVFKVDDAPELYNWYSSAYSIEKYISKEGYWRPAPSRGLRMIVEILPLMGFEAQFVDMDDLRFMDLTGF